MREIVYSYERTAMVPNSTCVNKLDEQNLALTAGAPKVEPLKVGGLVALAVRVRPDLKLYVARVVR